MKGVQPRGERDPSERSRLVSDALGEIEKQDGVLVIKRIHVRHRLRLDNGDRDTALARPRRTRKGVPGLPHHLGLCADHN